MTIVPGNVFRRELKRPLPFAAAASGSWITDADGKRYLDASGGPIVVNTGHGREEIAAAVARQIRTCDYIHPTMFTGSTVETLASSLTRKAPEGIDRWYFMTSGSEAVETALKLARQIHLEKGQPERFRTIARSHSYHGLTLGALSVSGKPALRDPFAPMLPDARHIPPPYCLRCAYHLTHPECDLRCADALEEAILQAGPETVSAFIAETVGGATAGVIPPPPGYLPRIREICHRHGVLLILDEILCGLGRTGRWFACSRDRVVPDILTLGKGLGGGCVPISAIGVLDAHFEAIATGSGRFAHGGTFSHHQVGAAAANAVLRILETEQLVERVAREGRKLGNRLRSELAHHPHVAEIRGMGFLWGIEIVQEKRTLTPFPKSARMARRVWQALFDSGVLLYPISGFVDGAGDALIVGPPFTVTAEEIDILIRAVREALDRETEGQYRKKTDASKPLAGF